MWRRRGVVANDELAVANAEVFYFLLLTFSLCVAYPSFFTCFDHMYGLSGNVAAAYDFCGVLNTDTPAFARCRNDWAKVFYGQMMGLGLATVSAYASICQFKLYTLKAVANLSYSAIYGFKSALHMRKFYVIVNWLNKQLRSIKEARANMPLIEDELPTLGNSVAADLERGTDALVSFESKGESRSEHKMSDAESHLDTGLSEKPLPALPHDGRK
jgi:hypothetical protein